MLRINAKQELENTEQNFVDRKMKEKLSILAKIKVDQVPTQKHAPRRTRDAGTTISIGRRRLT